MAHLLFALVLLLAPVLGWAYTFDHTILNFPNATYGVANEPCESPSGSDVTLNPGGAGAAWETALEGASPGQRFFLNAGTYGSGTGVFVIMPNGTSTGRILVKPNNCAAVTINGRMQPGSYTTLAGMNIQHMPGTDNGFGITGTVVVGASNRTGILIRNNRIAADDHYVVYVGSNTARDKTTVHSNITIEGNDLVFPGPRNTNNAKWNILYTGGPGGRDTICNACVVTRNKVHSAGQEADLFQPYLWGGTWTISRNWWTSSTAAHYGNMVDIKLTKMGTFQNTMDVVENYFHGTNYCVDCGCNTTHNASDFRTNSPPADIICEVSSPSCAGPGDYAYTVNARGNYFKNCKRVVWDHRISQRSNAEIADVNNRTLNFTYNVIDSDLSDVRVRCESNNCLLEHNTFIRGKINTGGWTPTNMVVRNNIHWNTVFENAAQVDVCSHNNFFNATGTPSICTNTVTGDPLFINIASNWDLQTNSPSRATSSTGTNRGAVTTVATVTDYVTGMVMHLPFDENTGTHAEDSIGGDHDGTLGSGASWGLPKNGAASVTFDGTINGVVTVPGLLGTPASVTLAAWVKRGTFPTPNGEIVSLGNVVAIRQSATGVSGKYQSAAGVYTFAFGTVDLGTDWHHLAYTATPGLQKFYVDGVPIGTSAGGAGIVWTGQGSNTVIGGHGAGLTDVRFQGSIDNVRVYNRALTDADIGALAAAVDVSALAVQITSPTTNPTLAVSSATLTSVGGSASGPLPITGVTFTCPTCTPSSGSATGTTTWTLPTLTLGPGSNLLTVRAVDGTSPQAQDTLTITYTPPPVAGACTYYASQGGTGNGLSQGSPFQVVNFMALPPAPGSTLCLVAGTTFTGANSMLQPPAGLSGSSVQPITVRPITDGAVTLDGQNARNPVLLGPTNEWWIIQGLNARNGLTAVYEFLGQNNLGQRLIGWNATSGQANSTVFTVLGNNTWVEDCAAWGTNVRTLFQGSGASASTGGYRRCWGEWRSHPGGTALPGRVMVPGEGQRFENMLGTWHSH